MITIECYELKYPIVGFDYFAGGHSSNAREWKTEYFLTKEEAEEERHRIMENYRNTEFFSPKWWADKYAYKDELATITHTLQSF